MPDDPKKKRLDSHRIALGQKHEVSYLRKKARQLIILCEKDMKYSVRARSKSTVVFISKNELHRFSVSTIHRIAKAMLLLLKKKV